MAAYYPSTHFRAPRYSHLEAVAQSYEEQAARARAAAQYQARRSAPVYDFDYEDVYDYAPRAPLRRAPPPLPSRRAPIYADYVPERHYVPELRYYDDEYDFQPEPVFAQPPPPRAHPDELEREFLRDLASQEYDTAFRAWRQKYGSSARVPSYEQEIPVEHYERSVARPAPLPEAREYVPSRAIAPARSRQSLVQSRPIQPRAVLPPVFFLPEEPFEEPPVSREQLSRNNREANVRAALARAQAEDVIRTRRQPTPEQPNDLRTVLELLGLQPTFDIEPQVAHQRQAPSQANAAAAAHEQHRAAEKAAFLKAIASQSASAAPQQSAPRQVRFANGPQQQQQQQAQAAAQQFAESGGIDVARVMELIQALQGGQPAPEATSQQPAASASSSKAAPEHPKTVAKTSVQPPVEKSLQKNAPETYTYAAPASVQLSRTPSPPATSSAPKPVIAHPDTATAEAEQLQQAIRASLETSPAVRAPSPTPSASSQTHSVSPSIAAIESIEESFVNLKFDFSFPSHVDFAPDGSSHEMLFTPTNAPIRQYEHALLSLLTKLDEVDSEGDDEVRFARKELVLRIENVLDQVDEAKREAWSKQFGVSEEPAVEAPSTVAPEIDAGPAEEVLEPVPEDAVAEEPAQVVPDEDVAVVDEVQELVPVDADVVEPATDAVDDLVLENSVVGLPVESLAVLADESSPAIETEVAEPEPVEPVVIVIPEPTIAEETPVAVEDASAAVESPPAVNDLPIPSTPQSSSPAIASSPLLPDVDTPVVDTQFPPRAIPPSQTQFKPIPPRSELPQDADSDINDSDLELQSVSSEDSSSSPRPNHVEVDSENEDLPASMEESAMVEQKLDFIMI